MSSKTTRPNALFCSTYVSQFFVTIVGGKIYISHEPYKVTTESLMIDMKTVEIGHAVEESVFEVDYKKKTPPQYQALPLWEAFNKNFRIKRKNIHEHIWDSRGIPLREIFSLTYKQYPAQEPLVLRFEAKKGEAIKRLENTE